MQSELKNIDTILTELDATTSNLQNDFLHFTNDNFNQRPSPAEWSAAHIAEHLLLIEVIAANALTGAGIPTNRVPDEKLAIIKWAMLNETKRFAPDVVNPTGGEKELQKSLEQLIQQREELKKAVIAADLSEACTSFKHPALGTLTKLEWAWFVIYHMQRHLKQLNNVRERILQQ